MQDSNRSCGSDIGLDCVLSFVTASAPDWAALYMPGFDGYSKDCDPPLSPHRVYRHYPGEGAWAMAWVVNKRYVSSIRRISWHGRAGSLFLESPRSKSQVARSALYLVGMHGAHGESLKDSFTDRPTGRLTNRLTDRFTVRETNNESSWQDH